MKKLMASIIFFVFSITLALAQTPQPSNGSVLIQMAKPSTDVTLRTWVLVVTPQTKKHYLDSVSAAWKKDSISLKFSKLKYNAEGKLVKIKGMVDIKARGEHASGSFGSENLESYEIKLDDRPGVSLKGK